MICNKYIFESFKIIQHLLYYQYQLQTFYKRTYLIKVFFIKLVFSFTEKVLK